MSFCLHSYFLGIYLRVEFLGHRDRCMSSWKHFNWLLILSLSIWHRFNSYSSRLKCRCGHTCSALKCSSLFCWLFFPINFIVELSSLNVILLLFISKVNEAYACELTGFWTGYSCILEGCFCHTLLRSQQPSTNKHLLVLSESTRLCIQNIFH